MRQRDYRAIQQPAIVAALALSWAVYINRHSTANRGAVTFTGNTLGLIKQTNANAHPWQRGPLGGERVIP